MADAAISFRNQKKFLQHLRTDNWWIEPAYVLFGFSAFIIYSSWAAFQGNYYWVGPQEGFGGYLSPFYSPPLFIREYMNFLGLWNSFYIVGIQMLLILFLIYSAIV